MTDERVATDAEVDPVRVARYAEAILQVAVDHPMWIDGDGEPLDYTPEREARIGEFVDAAARAVAAVADAVPLTWGATQRAYQRGKGVGHMEAEGLVADAAARAEAAEAECERWKEKAIESGSAYANANTKHHEELDRANRLEAMCERLSERAVKYQDAQRRAEAKLAKIEALHRPDFKGWCEQCSVSPCDTAAVLAEPSEQPS